MEACSFVCFQGRSQSVPPSIHPAVKKYLGKAPRNPSPQLSGSGTGTSSVGGGDPASTAQGALPSAAAAGSSGHNNKMVKIKQEPVDPDQNNSSKEKVSTSFFIEILRIFKPWSLTLIKALLQKYVYKWSLKQVIYKILVCFYIYYWMICCLLFDFEDRSMIWTILHNFSKHVYF